MPVTQKLESITAIQDENISVLSRLAEACILFYCNRMVTIKRNFLRNRHDTITESVKGKWRLRNMVLNLMKTLLIKHNEDVSNLEGTDLLRAFEERLDVLVKNGMILRQEEPLGIRRRYTYKITDIGISKLMEYDSIMGTIMELQDMTSSSRQNTIEGIDTISVRNMFKDPALTPIDVASQKPKIIDMYHIKERGEREK